MLLRFEVLVITIDSFANGRDQDQDDLSLIDIGPLPIHLSHCCCILGLCQVLRHVPRNQISFLKKTRKTDDKKATIMKKRVRQKGNKRVCVCGPRYNAKSNSFRSPERSMMTGLMMEKKKRKQLHARRKSRSSYLEIAMA